MPSPFPKPRELSERLGFRVSTREIEDGLLLAVQVFLYDQRDVTRDAG